MTVSLCSCAGCRKKEETKAKEKETIELWHYWDIPDNQRHLEELVEQFNKMQEDIEIEPAQPENWQKEKILLEMTEQEIPYKIYEFYQNNPEETDREAYLYELYGDVKREAHIKDGILIAESGSSGLYILWSEGTSMKEAFWYWDEVSLEIGKRIEKGTYLPLLSVSEEALENGEDIEEETLQKQKKMQ